MLEPNNRLEGLTILYDAHNGREIGKFHTPDGDFYWGGQGVRGRILIQDRNDRTLFEYDAEHNLLIMRNRAGVPTICINGETGDMYTMGKIGGEIPESLKDIVAV